MLDTLYGHAGALPDYSELRLHRNHSTRLAMRKGSLISNHDETNAGVSARCHKGGLFGFASMPGQNKSDIDRVLRAAQVNASLDGARTRKDKSDLPHTPAGVGEFDYRSDAPALCAADRVDIVRDIDAYVAKTYTGLVNADIAMVTLTIEKALVTSAGANTYSYVPRSNLILKFSMQANDGIVDLYEVLGGFGDAQTHFQTLDWIYEATDTLHENLRLKAEGTYCDAGTHDVILDSDVAGILAHEAIGHTCEADLVLGGSVAGGMRGKQVASEKITLTDYAQRGPTGDASIAIHVDDEGTPCRDVAIIERGVLKEFLTDKATALELGVEPTGNARAYAFNDEPLVRMRNTAIEPGGDKLEDMIGAVENGYYLKHATNGQADATSEFMFGIDFGFEIRDGKLGRALRDTTISGVAFDMLKTVTHVGDEVTWSRGGMCGKKQLIPVGMGGPAIKCKINVGGR